MPHQQCNHPAMPHCNSLIEWESQLNAPAPVSATTTSQSNRHRMGSHTCFGGINHEKSRTIGAATLHPNITGYHTHTHCPTVPYQHMAMPSFNIANHSAKCQCTAHTHTHCIARTAHTHILYSTLCSAKRRCTLHTGI